MFATTYAYMLIWSYTSEVNSKRIRERYLKAVLRQDIAFFDQLGAGEVATRIQTDTHLIQQGISEKVASKFWWISSWSTLIPLQSASASFRPSYLVSCWRIFVHGDWLWQSVLRSLA